MNSLLSSAPRTPERIAPRSRPPAVVALTAARFFAAVHVVFYHFGRESVQTIWKPLGLLVATGPVAVSFFYLLSGLVLTWGGTDANGQATQPRGRFWMARAARILPIYYLALLLDLPPQIAQMHALHGTMGTIWRLVFGLISALFLLQAFCPPIVAGLNTPGWSISCEAFFYLVWPRWVGRLSASRVSFWRLAGLLYVAILVPPIVSLLLLRSRLLPTGPFLTLLEAVPGAEFVRRISSFSPPLRLAEFALGICLGHALRHWPAPKASFAIATGREVGAAILLLAALLLLGAAHVDRVLLESGLLAPVFALLLWQLVRGGGALSAVLSHRWFVALGEASYGLYILQEPIYNWFTHYARHWFADKSDRLLFWPYLAIMILVSLLVHRAFDVPVRTFWLRRWGRAPVHSQQQPVQIA